MTAKEFDKLAMRAAQRLQDKHDWTISSEGCYKKRLSKSVCETFLKELRHAFRKHIGDDK